MADTDKSTATDPNRVDAVKLSPNLTVRSVTNARFAFGLSVSIGSGLLSGLDRTLPASTRSTKPPSQGPKAL